MKWTALVWGLGVSSLAWADVPPPDTQGCVGKKSGDACKADNGGSAVCAESTCSRVSLQLDGGRATSNFSCLLCNGKSGGCAAVPGGMIFAGLALLGLLRRR